MRNPTGRQLRFGTELRKLRERAGLSVTEAGQLIGIRQTQVSNMEAGRVGMSPDRVRAVACHYECSDKALVDALCAMASKRTRGWWEEYRDILPSGLIDLAETEDYATRLQAGTTAHIPGLLHIHDHAREIFRQVVPELSPPAIEHRLSFRIKRQAVLFNTNPTPYRVIVHEAALRMQFGGPTVAKRQLAHVLEMSERPHITIQAIPFTAGAFPGAGQSIVYMHGAVPQLDTVHLDQSHGSAFLNAEHQLAKYRELLRRMEGITLTPQKSRDLIHAITQDL